MKKLIFPAITLCGSTYDKDLWIKVQKDLTLKGLIILTVGFFGHLEGLDFASPTKIMLDDMHFDKIRRSEGIFVLNKNQKIGLSTCDEITYAMVNNKLIWFLETIKYKSLDEEWINDNNYRFIMFQKHVAGLIPNYFGCSELIYDNLLITLSEYTKQLGEV